MLDVMGVKDKDKVKDDDTPTYLPWLSQYLVMKRVSIEPNFHPLYSSFVDALACKKFHELVLKETHRNIKV